MSQPQEKFHPSTELNFSPYLSPEEIAYYTTEAYRLRNQVAMDVIHGIVNFARKSVSDLQQIFAPTRPTSH